MAQTKSEDAIGCVLVLGAAIWGGYWLYNHVAILPDKITAIRPTGIISLGVIDGSTWTLDASSVTGPRPHRQGWITIASKPTGPSNIVKTQNLYMVDCDNQSTKILTTATYDAQGKSVWSDDKQESQALPQHFPPGSIGGNAAGSLCQAGFDKAPTP